MAAIRRHPALFGLCTFIFILSSAAAWWIVGNSTPALAAVALVMDEPEPLDPRVAAQIDRLRRDTGLDDDALACLNVNLETLTAVLEATKTWHSQHAVDFTTTTQAIADCSARIRAAQSAINNGQDANAALATARGDLAEQLAAYELLLAACRTTATDELTEEQRTRLTQLLSRRAISMPYRSLALSSQQDGSLSKARIRYEQARSVSREVESQEAALTTFVEQRNTAIGGQNVAALAALQAYWSESAARVVVARNAVLPSPVE